MNISIFDDSTWPFGRAKLATLAFTISGLVSVFWFAPLAPALLPELAFYSLLLIHTYLSVRLFSTIQPKDFGQICVDAVLTGLYIWLAFSLGTVVMFLFANLCLFIVASGKYVLMFGRVQHGELLRRKTLADLLGAVLGAFTLGVALLGYQSEAVWALCLLFTIASIHYLITNPLYKL